MKREVLPGRQHHGVACIVAALIAHNPLHTATEKIGGLSFALVTPLGADEHDCRHGISPAYCDAAGDTPYPSRPRGAALTTTDVVVLLFGGRRVPRALRDLRGGQPRRHHGPQQGRRRGIRRRSCFGTDPVAAGRPPRCGGRPRAPTVARAPGAHRQGATGSAHPRRDRQRHRRRRRMARPTAPLHGEAVVDDTVLFDGVVPGVRIEPTRSMPGLRAAVLGKGPRRWVDRSRRSARHRCRAGACATACTHRDRPAGRRSIDTPRAGCGSSAELHSGCDPASLTTLSAISTVAS